MSSNDMRDQRGNPHEPRVMGDHNHLSWKSFNFILEWLIILHSAWRSEVYLENCTWKKAGYILAEILNVADMVWLASLPHMDFIRITGDRCCADLNHLCNLLSGIPAGITHSVGITWCALASQPACRGKESRALNYLKIGVWCCINIHIFIYIYIDIIVYIYI